MQAALALTNLLGIAKCLRNIRILSILSGVGSTGSQNSREAGGGGKSVEMTTEAGNSYVLSGEVRPA